MISILCLILPMSHSQPHAHFYLHGFLSVSLSLSFSLSLCRPFCLRLTVTGLYLPQGGRNVCVCTHICVCVCVCVCGGSGLQQPLLCDVQLKGNRVLAYRNTQHRCVCV